MENDPVTPWSGIVKKTKGDGVKLSEVKNRTQSERKPGMSRMAPTTARSQGFFGLRPLLAAFNL
jgi:hypothetical protein